MISSLSFVVAMVIIHKERCIIRQRINYTAAEDIFSARIILGALCIQRAFLCKSLFLAVLGIKVAVGVDTRHIIHGNSNGCLDSGIECRSIDGQTAPAADTENPDSIRIDIFLHGKEIDRCLKIFRVDIRRCHISGHSAAFSRKRRIKCYRQKTALCKCLCIQSAALLLYCTERAAYCDCRKLIVCIFRNIQISG